MYHWGGLERQIMRAEARCGSTILKKPIRIAPKSHPAAGRRNISGMGGTAWALKAANNPPIPEPSWGGIRDILEPAPDHRKAAAPVGRGDDFPLLTALDGAAPAKP